ncbi:MAG: RsmD family RNA methyltransferase [candidate division WOR-3 bacterium]
MNIIGGVAGGHKIFAPDNIRPTRGKVREALFSMINVEGKTFLDLFAGSGAVGIEALSRGAAKVVFVERSRKAASYIKRNLDKTKFERKIDAVLKKDSVIIVERSSDEELDYNGFKKFKSKVYGDTALVFLKR